MSATRYINSYAELCYKGGFAPALLVYTPTLSLPLETRGRAPLGARWHGRSPTRTYITFAQGYPALT